MAFDIIEFSLKCFILQYSSDVKHFFNISAFSNLIRTARVMSQLPDIGVDLSDLKMYSPPYFCMIGDAC